MNAADAAIRFLVACISMRKAEMPKNALIPSYGSNHAKRVAIIAAGLPCSRPYRSFHKVMHWTSVKVELTRGAGPAGVIGWMGLHCE
jgi:hypothetical protein